MHDKHRSTFVKVFHNLIQIVTFFTYNETYLYRVIQLSSDLHEIWVYFYLCMTRRNVKSGRVKSAKLATQYFLPPALPACYWLQKSGQRGNPWTHP